MSEHTHPQKFLPREIYEKIHAAMPIFCVDLVIERDGKFLLLKRDVEPDKGKYWFPGGRLIKGETILAAVARIAWEETNLSIEIVNLLGYTDCQFPADPFGHGQGTHTVSLVFRCRAIGGEVKVDERHTDARWWDVVRRPNMPDMPSVVEGLLMKAAAEVHGWKR